MGRYIGASSGSDVIVKAGEAILAGDVVCVSPAGVVYRGTGDMAYDAASNAPVMRNIIQFESNDVFTASGVETPIGSITQCDSTACTLGNGNFVLCGIKYYSTGTDGYVPAFTVVSPTGAEVVAVTDITTTRNTNVWKAKPVKLDADRFLVLYGVGADKSLYFSIFANDGTQLKGQTDVGYDATQNDAAYVSVCVLENGDIVFSWDLSNTQLNTLRFDSTGTVKGVVKTWSGIASTNKLTVIPGSGGEFFINTFPYGGESQSYVVSETDVALANIYPGGSRDSARGFIQRKDSGCMTENGTYVGLSLHTSENKYWIYFVGPVTSWAVKTVPTSASYYFDGTKTFIDSYPIIKNLGNNRVGVLTNHSFATNPKKTFLYRVFDTSGATPVQLLETFIGNPMDTANIAYSSLFSADLVGGRLVVYRSQQETLYFAQNKLFVIDPLTGATIGDELETYRYGYTGASSGTTVGGWSNCSSVVSGNSLCLFGYWISQPQTVTKALFLSANESNIIGVAKAAAAKGQDVIVGQTGKFAINQTYATTSLGKHDTLPGVTGILDGNVAYLAGA